MSMVKVILKSGTAIEVVNCDEAEWISERTFAGAGGMDTTLRLVVKEGTRIAAKFNGSDIAGYTVVIS